MEKKLCSIHRYFYSGNECPICSQERLQRMASKWVPENMGIPKDHFEKKKETTETMDEMLNKLKDKFNNR